MTKADLQLSIAKLLDDYEKAAGVVVGSIEIAELDVSSLHDTRPQILRSVLVHADLAAERRWCLGEKPRPPAPPPPPPRCPNGGASAGACSGLKVRTLLRRLRGQPT